MASSGAIYGSIKNGSYSIRVDWTVTSQDITNNTSTIKCDLHFINNYSISIGARTHTITVDGTPYYLQSGNINSTGDHYIGSISHTVEHNADGSKSLSISAEFSLKATLSGVYYENITGSGAITLDTIARASIPSLSAYSLNFGDKVTIYTNRASESFTHNILVSFGGGYDSGIATDVGDSFEYPIPMNDWLQWIPNTTYNFARFTVETYSNGILIGSNQVSLDLYVQDSIVPTITSVTPSDSTAMYSTYGGYVQGKSKLNVAVASAGAYGSTIKATTIKVNGSAYSDNFPLNTAGTNTITVTVTDSRGRVSTTTTKEISVLAYSVPTISSLKAVRCDANGTENEEGAYIKATYSASITSLNNKNGKQFNLQSKLSTASSWTNQATYTSAYSWSSSTIFAADVNNIYNVRLVATDSFTTNTNTIDVGTAFTLMDFNADGKGVSFGSVSTNDGLALNMLTYTNGTIGQNGSIIRPKGCSYASTVAPLIGALCISFKDGWIDKTMMSFWVDIYNYATDSSVSYFISGYMYSTGKEWYNCTVQSFTKPSNTYGNLTTYLGYNSSGYPCVMIGEYNTSWTCPQVQVRDILIGYHPYINNFKNGIEINFVTSGVTKLKTVTNPSVLLAAYPIGSIYQSTVSTSPATLFGGTWTALYNRFLIGAGSSYSNGATGGETTHTLTIQEMPAHSHNVHYDFGQSGGNRFTVNSSYNQNDTVESSCSVTGGSQAHNNMPPYLAVYMWKRTA